MALQLKNSLLFSINFRKVFQNHFAAFSDSKTTRIVEVLSEQPLGSNKTIKGWISSVRKMKDTVFVDVNDGSCPDKLQVVVNRFLKPNHLSYGASVEVEGIINKNNNEQLELRANNVIVVGPCSVSEGYPFAGKVHHPPEFTRKFLHMRSRTSKFNSVMRVRDAATRAIHSYFGSEGYLNIHTPVLTSNDCEGAGEVFMVIPENLTHLEGMIKKGKALDEAYFDTRVFLTVSGQLHLEAIARGLGNVYSFGPTFRAENSRSRLHLSEFYMVEAESVFMNDLDDLLKLIETFLKDITCQVLTKCERDIVSLQDEDSKLHIHNILEKSFQVLTYSEACCVLQKHFNGPKASGNEGLSKEQELFLVDFLGKVPVFIVEWPRTMKPFYMKQMSDSSKVAAVDLLVPQVGELCGGSIREDDLTALESKLQESGMLNSLEWYLELRKYGNISTGGFGMGFERFLQVILGVRNIKDTIPFPRWAHNCSL